MNKLLTLGIAAALVLGGSTAGFALDAKVGANAQAGEAGAAVDATTTASVGGNINSYSTLASDLQSGSSADLSTFTDTAAVNCVKVSSFSDSDASAQLDTALSAGQDARATLQSDIQKNSALWTKIQASCGIADLAVQDVISVRTDASGAFTIYVDDRA